MQKQKGFTLVELLVVITIIGILATGAISMFTGAQQKARDSVRITDIQAVKLALEQYYGDNAKYPQTVNATASLVFAGAINSYIDKIPKDPKSSQPSTTTKFFYLYAGRQNATGIAGQEYEVSTTFENSGNLSSKALNLKDNGSDDDRLEIGINTFSVNTSMVVAGTCVTNSYATADVENVYIIDTSLACV